MFSLNTVCEKLATVREKIHSIGVQMGVEPYKIREFKLQPDPMCELIENWLKGNVGTVTPSWQSLVDVLKSDHVGEIGLGNKIFEECCCISILSGKHS